MNLDIIYLNNFINLTKNGTFQGLNNKKFRKFVTKLKSYSEVSEIFQIDRVRNQYVQVLWHKARTLYNKHCLTKVIKGSTIYPYIKDEWGYELIERRDEDGNDIIRKRIHYW